MGIKGISKIYISTILPTMSSGPTMLKGISDLSLNLHVYTLICIVKMSMNSFQFNAFLQFIRILMTRFACQLTISDPKSIALPFPFIYKVLPTLINV